MKIADLFVKLGLKSQEFDKGIDKSEKKVSGFSNTLKKIGTAIAGAFAVSQIADFTKEVVMLAAEAEGVEKAFTRIGGQRELDNLRRATRGTVSDLELMRQTVTASNLGLPVENLAKLFEFAAARANDTGQSVTQLVGDISIGIGRKSTMVLDNLGISAIELKENLNGVSLGAATIGQVTEAVERIATKSLNKIGDAATTNGQKIQSFAATWDNLKLSVGRVITTSREFGVLSDILSGLNKLLSGTNENQNKINEGAKRIFDSWNKSGKLTEETINARIKSLKEENKQLLRGGDFANKTTRDRRKGNLELIRLLNERLKAIENETKAQVIQADTIESVEKELETLKELKKKQSGDALAQTNKEIESLQNYLKWLNMVGTAETQRRAAQLKTEADLPDLPEQQLAGTGINTVAQAGALNALGDAFAETEKRQADFIANQQSFNQSMAMLAADLVADTVEVFAAGIGEMFSGDFDVAEFGKSLLQAVGNFLTTLGKMMIQFGTTALIYATLAKALANPATAAPAAIAMIAAGAALVAIGSAIGSFASSGSAWGAGGAITTIDTRAGATSNATGGLQDIELRRERIEVVGNISNKTIALSSNLGQKDIRK